jgi:hypothetical protein
MKLQSPNPKFQRSSKLQAPRRLGGVCEGVVVVRSRRSPSPRPSPAGRGRKSASARSAEASLSTERGLRFSLSQRERAGVREKSRLFTSSFPLQPERERCGLGCVVFNAESQRTQSFAEKEAAQTSALDGALLTPSLCGSLRSPRLCVEVALRNFNRIAPVGLLPAPFSFVSIRVHSWFPSPVL